MRRGFALVVFTLAAACGPAKLDPPPPDAGTGPTWHRDIHPFVATHCAGCHAEGGIGPFPLTTADEVKVHAPAMLAAMQARVMPPWMPDEDGCAPLKNSQRLSDADIERFAAWVEGGKPLGDEATAATLREPGKLPWVDLTLDTGEPYTPKSTSRDDYHCFIVDPALTGNKDVVGFQVQPGAKREVHHVLMYSIPRTQAQALDDAEAGPGWTCFGGPGTDLPKLVGGWVPGTDVVRLPQQTGVRIYTSDVLVVQIHYNLDNGPAVPDRTSMLLQFSSAPVTYPAQMLPLVNWSFRLPPHSTGVVAEATFESPADAQLWGAIPHQHVLGKSISVDIEPAGPVNRSRCVVNVPKWDFHWQQFYFLASPTGMRVSKGQKFHLRCEWDNPTDQNVRWGESTSDEMCLAFLYLTGAL